ncbi:MULTISPECIES: DUF4231 domain-containing protein [unclassified Pseudofrankia]|uniref:DUF4231 domain-containing protein n=1 Tax=unclassified Pseudofrankia TaxID=2994372 RepID=UPI0008D8FBB3|nr:MULTISPECIES: DUF4231 domain-containing protein [unclassified Pseudofrankia]MDT3443543.1 DUF4231 domain-containing protein [Pseudofrankia sp. BMG5.37]OHV42742.1 hypothetical protein BCD48_30350 [Pseudofrankia sp. BMG5.36]
MSGIVYPALHKEASSTSAAQQAMLFRLTKASLVLAVLSALFGALPIEPHVGETEVDVATWIAIVAFIGVFVCNLALALRRPERTWYDARAVAESVKSLSWQFAVGGGEFAEAERADGKSPEDVFRGRMDELLERMKEVGVDRLITHGPSGGTPSPSMTDLRTEDLIKRIDQYVAGRLDNQRNWYRKNARKNATNADRFLCVSIFIPFAGIVLGLVGVLTSLDVDFVGIAAAAAAAALAWTQSKDFETIARAYQHTERDLVKALDEVEAKRATYDDADKTWADFVDSAEQAISREHTLWLARRGVPPRETFRAGRS